MHFFTLICHQIGPHSFSNLFGLLPRSNITATGSRRLLWERSGKDTGSCRKAPDIPGIGSSIPAGNSLEFFQWIPVNFLCVPSGTGRKSSRKTRKISDGNTASIFQRFPVLSCRNRSVFFDLGMCLFCINYPYFLFFRPSFWSKKYGWNRCIKGLGCVSYYHLSFLFLAKRK
jgi:hypothetical protein